MASRGVVPKRRVAKSGTNNPDAGKKLFGIPFARMWPRDVFDYVPIGRKQALAHDKDLADILGRPGVYVLCRDDVPYYIGQARNLLSRVEDHADTPGSKHANFWNFFSVFVVEAQDERNRIEAILIAAMPTANSAKPKLARKRFPNTLRKMVRAIRRDRVSPRQR